MHAVRSYWMTLAPKVRVPMLFTHEGKSTNPMNTVYLVANGDLRLAANQICEPAQAAMEKGLVAAIQKEEFFLKRGHPFDEKKGHGFIDSQKAGIQIFHSIPKEAPTVGHESVWQYSQHILPGLFAHKGPVLTVANWSGT